MNAQSQNEHLKLSRYASSSENGKANKNYQPQLYVSTELPFLTSERTSISASPSFPSSYAHYIPLSSSNSLESSNINNKSYNSLMNSNDVNFDPPDFEEAYIEDTTNLIESIIKSYLSNKTLISSELKTTTEASELEFLTFSFDEEDEDLVRSKVKREDAPPWKVT